MKSSDFFVDVASRADLPAIMELERGGFIANIIEEESVFRSRFEIFPQGFLVLRDSAREKAWAYLATELWAADPGSEREAFSLGHDPAPRFSASGTVLYTASMTVAPELRGLGLGDRLFREGRAHIVAGFPRIELELLIVNEHWRGARKIYEAAGFALRSVFSDFFAAEREAELYSGGRVGRAAAILMERRVPR